MYKEKVTGVYEKGVVNQKKKQLLVSEAQEDTSQPFTAQPFGT
jgi:hypothetical protein